MEAGFGTLLRLLPGQADLALVVVQPTAKSLEVGRRALRVADARKLPVMVVANRVHGDDDMALIQAAVGEQHPLVVVPEEAAIAEADRDGRAPVDVDAHAPGVRALLQLAQTVAANGSDAGPR